ncbi:cytochrome P450 family protein [Yinghuangia sp. YIM S10712]|uniref:cytochrome P450 family protein n=1 Tax=Yinghuangia sp. YIM S10712 TaxID=3436930 RepID=UPI003F52B081
MDVTAPSAPARRGTPEHASGIRLLDPDLLADPAGGYGRMREQGPVVRAWLTDDRPVWVITRYDDVRAGLRDPRFASSPAAVPGHTGEDPRKPLLDMLGLPDEVLKYFMVSALDTDPPDHTRLRGAVQGAFTHHRMQALRPRIRQVAAELLDALPAKQQDGTVDLIEEFAYPLAITVVCELVGVPASHRAPFVRWGDDILSMDPELLAASSPAVIDTVHELLDERRAAPADDLLTTLARAADERFRLSDVEQVAMVLNIVMAGYDNTAQLVANSIAALHAHPAQLRRLTDDPALLPDAVEEFVRWCGPDIMVRMRFAAEDIDFHGTRIGKGDAVQFILVSANRDPRRHPDPDGLDITRCTADKSDGHLGFGHGIHYCLGASLARRVCEVGLAELLARHPRLPLAVPACDLTRRVIPGAAPRLTTLPLELQRSTTPSGPPH